MLKKKKTICAETTGYKAAFEFHMWHIYVLVVISLLNSTRWDIVAFR